MSYYQFVNVTKNLNNLDDINIKNIGILSLFDSIIQFNNWKKSDVIMAFPIKKNNPIFRYSCGDIELKMESD